jgi:oxalate decarboxylase/phosphoglucose isomerase-like protein (cupin superfamily)
VRGNHFHKRTHQWAYILTGRMKYYSKDKHGKVSVVSAKAGDLIDSPATVAHTFLALTDLSFLSLTKGPRRGFDYEKDTFRLEDKLA